MLFYDLTNKKEPFPLRKGNGSSVHKGNSFFPRPYLVKD
jgi:hypothetical protein